MNAINLNKNNEPIELVFDKTVVFIGANGSGKSRLGAWIEQENSKKVHRISAQRNLSFTEEIALRSYEKSHKFFQFGGDFQGHQPDYLETYTSQAKASQRWQNGKMTTGYLNDYDHLLAMLYSQQNLRNEVLSKKIGTSIGQTIDENFKPSSNIEKLIILWNKLLPHRELDFSDQKIVVKKGSERYIGTELSDGERVIIYLIGQVLSVDSDSILIVDEPEIHIHKSIINTLWDELEKLRDDISIFYITHDLDFTRERLGSTKVWIKSYDGNTNWDFDVIDFENAEDFNQIHYEIMGSRKPVLFIEGEKGSLDFKLYSRLYKNHTVIPVKSCNTVIEMVSSYKKEWTLHNIKPIGIIDKDFREENEIELLNQKGIHVINVLEVENLFCLPAIANVIYDILSSMLHIEKSKDEFLRDVDNIIVSAFESDIEKLILNDSHRKISNLLSKFPKPKHTDNFTSKYTEHLAGINLSEITSNISTVLNTLKDEKDISKIICYIDNKGLSAQIANSLGMHKDRYLSTVIKNIDDERIRNVFFEYLPPVEVISQ